EISEEALREAATKGEFPRVLGVGLQPDGAGGKHGRPAPKNNRLPLIREREIRQSVRGENRELDPALAGKDQCTFQAVRAGHVHYQTIDVDIQVLRVNDRRSVAVSARPRPVGWSAQRGP